MSDNILAYFPSESAAIAPFVIVFDFRKVTQKTLAFAISARQLILSHVADR
jgi:hypothetical protein